MAEVKKNVVAPAATEVKKEEVKKEAPKKAEVKKEAPKKEAPKKAEAKKAPAKKEAPKKAAAKKAPAKKAEVKETFAVQFAGKDYASDVIVKLVKDAYKATKNKAAIKTLNVYVNTDDSRAYYVINDEFHGSVEL
ncbi:MAG: DUF6465 family protein [Lachnospiraceae bacterium]|nr:DUF6465 family protein [Lachnospiraceae bacterium]